MAMENNNLTLEQLLDRFSDLDKYKADTKSRFLDVSFVYEENGERFVIFKSTTTFDGQTISSFAYSYSYMAIDPETGKLKPYGGCGYKDQRLESRYHELQKIHKIDF